MIAVREKLGGVVPCVREYGKAALFKWGIRAKVMGLANDLT